MSFRPVLGAVALASLAGCVVAPYPAGQPVYAGPAVSADVVVHTPPPAPYVEVVPVPPFAGAIWVAGYWSWTNGRHHWVPGRYVAPRPGYRYEPHRWVPGPRGEWHLRGGWVR
ncbi:MAG: hypothetical protein AB1434_09800 [Pseudomonadota bacterium]